MEINRSGPRPLFRRSAGRSRPLTEAGDDRDQIAQRLVEAYAQLPMTPPNRVGTRTVTLGQFGCAKVHLTQLPREQTGSSIPPLWLEVFSHDDGTTIDGYGCFDLEENELTAAVDLILAVMRRHMGRTCSRTD
jgi:hypothetical protein